MRATRPSSIASSGEADSRLRVAGAAVGIGAFAAMLAYLVQSIVAGDVSLGPIRAGPLGGALVLLLAAHGAQALAWHLLVRAAGGDAPATVDAGRWAMSLLGKYLPGKVFGAVGRMMLYRGRAPGPAGVAVALAAELLLTLTAAACVAAVLLAASAGAVPAVAAPAAAACALVGIVVSFSSRFDRAVAWLAARLLRVPAPGRVTAGQRVVPLLLQVCSYLLMGSGLQVLLLAWPAVAVPPLPPAALIGALCLSGIAGMAVFVVPAGLGVRDGALAWLLAPAAGAAPAAFIAVAARLWLTAGDAVAVIVGAWLLRRRGVRD